MTIVDALNLSYTLANYIYWMTDSVSRARRTAHVHTRARERYLYVDRMWHVPCVRPDRRARDLRPAPLISARAACAGRKGSANLYEI